MKNLEIKKISGFTTAQEIPALLDREGIEFQPIDTVNWPEYPYKPEVKFRVAHTGDYILIHYTVTEASVRAVAPHDGGRHDPRPQRHDGKRRQHSRKQGTLTA